MKKPNQSQVSGVRFPGIIEKGVLIASILMILVSQAFSAIPDVQTSGGVSMVLKADGTVWAWGNNESGLLGDGTTTNRNHPMQVHNLSDIVEISVGFNHALARKADGTVWAWGNNFAGKLGNGNEENQTLPVQISGLSGAISVAAGGSHSVAAVSGGDLYTWGSAFGGSLGDGATSNRSTPALVTTLDDVSSVSADGGSAAVRSDGTVYLWGTGGLQYPTIVAGLADVSKMVHSSGRYLALKSDGTVVGWGSNSMGQVGVGYSPGDISVPTAIAGLSGIVQLSAKGYTAFALKNDGSVWSWGHGGNGNLGNGALTSRSVPGQVLGINDAIRVGAGIYHTIVLASDGTILTWGNGEFGGLGDGSMTIRPSPLRVMSHHGPFVGGGAGFDHTLAIDSNGEVWAWGANDGGQLGDGTTSARTAPVKVTGLSGITSVAANWRYSLALRNDGKVFYWGSIMHGLPGASPQQKTPIEITGLPAIKSIHAGTRHSLAVDMNGGLWSWGNNTFGAVGHWNVSPTLVPGLGSGVSTASAGSDFSVAVKTDGTVWAWGDCMMCQLGTVFIPVGNPRNWPHSGITTPTQLQGLSNIKKLWSSDYHTLALDGSGRLWGWGYHWTSGLDEPSWVTFLCNPRIVLDEVVSAGAGRYHGVAVRKDGSVWSWGEDENGQLGSGSIGNFFPEMIKEGVAGRPDEILIAGREVSYKINADGRLSAVGSGIVGQLANGFERSFVAPKATLGLNAFHPVPQVSIVSPSAADTSVGPYGSVPITASASVSGSTVEKVYFYADGIYLGEDDTAPFSYTYAPDTWGNLEIHAIAVSGTGAISRPSNYIRVKSPFDSDRDGLGDRDEIDWFGSLANDGTTDTDGDRVADWLELTVTLTNPNVANSWPDTDTDGIPDVLEMHWFNNLSAANATSDADGNGIRDVLEIQAGQDPVSDAEIITRRSEFKYSSMGRLIRSHSGKEIMDFIFDTEGNLEAGTLLNQ